MNITHEVLTKYSEMMGEFLWDSEFAIEQLNTFIHDVGDLPDIDEVGEDDFQAAYDAVDDDLYRAWIKQEYERLWTEKK